MAIHFSKFVSSNATMKNPSDITTNHPRVLLYNAVRIGTGVVRCMTIACISTINVAKTMTSIVTTAVPSRG